MPFAYLDNNATTQVDPQVFEVMKDFFLQDFGNASSIHQPGQKARSSIERARRQVGDLLSADAGSIVFTSGGTEADNAAVRGVAAANRSKGNHIVTSSLEHPAILRSCEELETEGFEVTYLGAGEDGLVSVDELSNSLRESTILVSIMYANNETGTIQPLPDIIDLVHERGILVHTDAVQVAGKLPVDLRELQVDLLSISSHKLHGPKGVGALYLRPGTLFEPIMLGGSQERNRRGGTENVPGIVGFGEACEVASRGLGDFRARSGHLRDKLESGIQELIPDIHINGSMNQRMPHVTNISFQEVEGESLLIALDFHGISVSTGAACASGSISGSHVLKAMGLPESRINGAIRFSLGRFNTEEDIDYVLSVLPESVRRIREASQSLR